ncbi:hypothetical protein [Ferrimicrobium acidiphilum]
MRQVALLESYCAANGWTYEVIWGVMRTLLPHSERARLQCRWRVAIW